MKVTSLLLFLVLVISSLGITAQNDSDWKSRTYNVGEFQRIKLEGSFRVYLIQGNENLVEVRTNDADAFDYLEINNYESILKIEEDFEPFNFDRVNLYITFKTLEAVKIEGGVNLRTRGYLDLQDFEIDVEGGAKIDLALKAADVRVKGEGGVLFELDGVADNLNVKLSGAGHFDADELKTKHVTIKIEGVGTGSVYATETLNTKIEGVGKVRYRGNPEVTKNIEGLGKVTRD